MKTLVTGGGGFLGRYVVDALLEAGDEVTVLGRTKIEFFANTSVSSHSADIGNFSQIESHFRGMDRVIHTAAQVGVWGRWEDFYRTNVKGTQNVLLACIKNGISKLIYTSSPAVVFDGEDQRGVDESTAYASQWLSPYPKSKMLAEQLVLKQNGNEGLYTTVLRPHLIWGARDTHLIPRLIDRARKGQLRCVGDGSNWVDITHVKNAARAHLQAAEQLGPKGKCSGKAYFISQGAPVRLWDFIDHVLSPAMPPLPPPAVNRVPPNVEPSPPCPFC